MKITLHLLLQLFLVSVPYHLVQSTNSTYYYNQCSPSQCGDSILRFPFGMNALCRSAYITTTCENNKVYLTDDENKYIKYQLLQNLTDEVYSQGTTRLVDTSLFGCGTIPSFHDRKPNAGYESQKWLMLGAFYKFARAFRPGTFLNCTKEPDGDTLPRLIKAPCLECGPTSNFCYFYDGYIDHVDNCRPFRVNIPFKEFGNLSSVKNLRGILQQGFDLDWNGDCNSCMQNHTGRCGYVDEERKSSEQYCFCTDGVHKNNCTDGTIIQPDSVGKYPGKKYSKKPISLIIGVALGVAAMLLCASYILHRRKHNKKQCICSRGQDEQVLKHYLDVESGRGPASTDTFLKNYTLGRPTRFSYKQLKKYTNNFSHKIGQGGFGSVFQGKLPNGFIIAVKIVDESTNQLHTQFLNEVVTVGRIHHSHLVRLLGYCFDQSRIGLIYEFMVNGSLDKYIHQKKDISNKQPTLTWAQLHNIAIGTAKGLAYLHEECRNRILHCDIKPHNILLDEHLHAKVSDFGLAMALDKEKTHISMTHGTGTPGYAPPEMWHVKLGPMTDKSDVYSFGVVVLEMAGQRRNFDAGVSISNESYFPQWVFSHHARSAYGDSGHEEEGIAKRMELVGLWCIQFEPSNRPPMRKVVDMLEGNVAIQIPPAPFDAKMSRLQRN